MGRIVPIYEAMGGISSRMLRRIIYNALQNFTGDVPDLLPAEIRERYGFPTRREALLYVHFPPKDVNLELLNSFRSPAQMRLIFEEFFYYQFGLALRRQTRAPPAGIAMRVREDKIRDALKRILPFKPTAAQKRVLAEIAADLERPFPMHRLLEGDVGSGKTIVALEAATIVIENGYQVALMAPTEILAAQHYLSARRIFEPAGYKVALIVSGRKRAEKEAAIDAIESGEAQLVVGTHALIEDADQIQAAGPGDRGRAAPLRRAAAQAADRKGRVAARAGDDRHANSAHPRAHALRRSRSFRDRRTAAGAHADRNALDVGSAACRACGNSRGAKIARGRQVYVLYPVIEESKQELKAATAEYERLAKTVFPERRVGLLHGRLKNEEKDAVMEQFRRNELQILVATTVIEVGVDVPNATVMVIEHADRFGLAQLHQLRGRIGRGTEKSHCILVAPKSITGDARERIEAMVATSNGFEIAERDLKQRGPGEFFGTRQHGDAAFAFAQPLRDHELLELARREAFAIAEDPARAERIGFAPGKAEPHVAETVSFSFGG